MRLGALVRAQREALGLTQAQVAARAGVTRNITMIERGARVRVSLSVRIQLARALRLGMLELLSRAQRELLQR